MADFICTVMGTLDGTSSNDNAAEKFWLRFSKDALAVPGSAESIMLQQLLLGRGQLPRERRLRVARFTLAAPENDSAADERADKRAYAGANTRTDTHAHAGPNNAAMAAAVMMFQPDSMNSAANQSSRSGCVGGSP